MRRLLPGILTNSADSPDAFKKKKNHAISFKLEMGDSKLPVQMPLLFVFLQRTTSLILGVT